MIKIFIILISLGILFYILTYPYPFKLLRKIRRVMTFDEITYIENKDFDYDKISLQDFEKKLIVEKRILKSKGYIDEKLEYIVIKNRDEVRDNLPCLILLHGLRDCAEDWLGRGRIRENYLTLLKENKIDKMNIILLNSGYEGMGWYTNFYNDKSHKRP